MGRAFEYLCMDHASKIGELLGFSGIDFTYGPFFQSQSKETPGTQIDIAFNRKDNVITLVESKYSQKPVGLSIIQDVERKAEILKRQFKGKTIQRVLISKSDLSKDLVSSGYFYRIIKAEELFSNSF